MQELTDLKDKFKTVLVCLLFTSICFGQAKKDTSYCERSWCTFPKDHPAHFDPYYNGHLCENFDPGQTDFSKEYFDLQTKRFATTTDQFPQSVKYDFSSTWLTGETEQNGVIGLNYQRIEFHIDKVARSKNKPGTYIIAGKSKVKDNICNFSGELTLLKLYYFPACDDTSFRKCGELFGSYTFYEDSSQQHSGVFRGIMECSVYLDSSHKRILLDQSSSVADGYWNRTFIGTWTDYKTKQSKKCIWGDYRLPFVFDFMCGDGEMRACDKYVMNGWQSFNDKTEYIEVAEGKWELKDKWWLK